MGKFIERLFGPKAKKTEKESPKKEEPQKGTEQEYLGGGKVEREEKKTAPPGKEPAKKVEAEKITAEPEKPKVKPEQIKRAEELRSEKRKRFLGEEIKRDPSASRASQLFVEMPNDKGLKEVLEKRKEEIEWRLNDLSKSPDEKLKGHIRDNLSELKRVGGLSSDPFIKELPQVKRETPPIEQQIRIAMQVLKEKKITAENVEAGKGEKKFTAEEKEKNIREIFSKTPLAQENVRLGINDKVSKEREEEAFGELRSRVEGIKKIPSDKLQESINNNKDELEETNLYLEVGQGLIDEKKYAERKKILEEELQLMEGVVRGEL